MAIKFKKSKNHNPFSIDTIQERYLKEKEQNPQSNYIVDKFTNEYLIFKVVEQKTKE